MKTVFFRLGSLKERRLFVPECFIVQKEQAQSVGLEDLSHIVVHFTKGGSLSASEVKNKNEEVKKWGSFYVA